MGLEWLILELVRIGWVLVIVGCREVVTIGKSRDWAVTDCMCEELGILVDKWDSVDVEQEVLDGKVNGITKYKEDKEEVDNDGYEAKGKSNSWNIIWREIWDGMGLLWEKRGRVFGEQTLCLFFGWFGRQGTKLSLKKKNYHCKYLKILLYISFGWRRNYL